MRKYIAAAAVALVVLATLAGPAGAFRIASRNNFSGLFRDQEVCTDGLRFDIGTEDAGVGEDFEGFPEGAIPDGSLMENLYVTKDLSPTLPGDPGDALVPTTDTVLIDTFTVDPIPNTDPRVAGSNRPNPTKRLYWLSTQTAAWDEPLPVGTQLAVYLAQRNLPIETVTTEVITVTDCTLFGDPDPCDAPGAIVGTDGSDHLVGTPGDDVICGLGGQDLIIGLGGNDTIIAGAGKDTVFAGRGDDGVDGGPGRDWIFGGRGHDTLDGGEGKDAMFGGRGDDTLNGGPGHDWLVGGPGRDTINQ